MPVLLTVLRRTMLAAVAAVALLGTPGLVGAASASTVPNSCHDGGQPHAVHDGPMDTCTAAQ